MEKVNFSWRAEGIPSSSGSHFNTTQLYVPDGTSDADILAVGAALQALSNGTLVSVSKSILSGVLGPYGLATLNGGSNSGRVLARSATGKIQTFTIPFLRNNIAKSVIEAALEDAAGIVNLQNEFDEAMGPIVNVKLSQIVSSVP